MMPAGLIGIFALSVAAAAAAQDVPRKPGWSNDQSPLQRDLMVIEALMPGTYNNYEQVYFDDRLDLPADQRHARVHTEIRRIPNDRFGPSAFYIMDTWHADHRDGAPTRRHPRIYSFFVDAAENAVRMESYYFIGFDRAPYLDVQDDLGKLDALRKDQLTYVKGCDMFFTRVVGGFHGKMKPKACISEENGEKVYGDYQIMLGERALWKGDVIRRMSDDVKVNDEPAVLHKQNRARWFICSLSLGEGPDAKRFTGLSVHDGGDTAWVPVPTPEQPAREVGLHLRNVDWAMNNTRSGFTNDVFVFYLDERWPGQERRHIMYAYQAPDAVRAGINLLYMQGYCVLKETARPTPKL
ncbi:MAG: CpcT/CpeT family chromophore lyase [Rhodospirillaceae bacterium]|nr:CpcT/CpeT family chromophore lyase [Rhodospirillaceae bacterium]